MSSVFPVIMAGGSGTRFWPLSRSRRPKQLLALTGDKPLIVHAAERVQPLAPAENTFVVCGKAHAAPIRKLLPHLPAGNVVVEPVARNTAPAIALAATLVAHRNPQGVLVVLPSDHHVAFPDRFVAALRTAVEAAREGRLVTLGIQPTRPETGYGYIERGPTLRDSQPPVCAVTRFVEKPDLARAREYLASGAFFWNAGIFVFRADRVLEETRRHLPEAAAPLDALARAAGTAGFSRALARHFPLMPSISIDYGVMEKAQAIAVVPADIGWSDVGAFPALAEVRPLDADGNVSEGDALLFDVHDSVVLAGKRPLAVVGVSGLMVVDAGDAVLVCPRDRAQDVRRVVEELARRGRKDAL